MVEAEIYCLASGCNEKPLQVIRHMINWRTAIRPQVNDREPSIAQQQISKAGTRNEEY